VPKHPEGDEAPTPGHSHRSLRRLTLAAAAIAIIVAAGGIVQRWSEETAVAQWTAAQAIPTVSVLMPQQAVSTRHLALPGNIQAWYGLRSTPGSTAIRGKYVDYGAHVKNASCWPKSMPLIWMGSWPRRNPSTIRRRIWLSSGKPKSNSPKAVTCAGAIPRRALRRFRSRRRSRLTRAVPSRASTQPRPKPMPIRTMWIVRKLKPVTLGRNLGADVEVLNGLAPSDRVIDSPPASLASGDTVHVAGRSSAGEDVAAAPESKPQ
jgi:hypothetical protein